MGGERHADPYIEGVKPALAEVATVLGTGPHTGPDPEDERVAKNRDDHTAGPVDGGHGHAVQSAGGAG